MRKPATGIITLLFLKGGKGSFMRQGIDRISHNRPLMTLLGAKGNRIKQHGIKAK